MAREVQRFFSATRFLREGLLCFRHHGIGVYAAAVGPLCFEAQENSPDPPSLWGGGLGKCIFLCPTNCSEFVCGNAIN